jgi:hypothetical protein
VDDKAQLPLDKGTQSEPKFSVFNLLGRIIYALIAGCGVLLALPFVPFSSLFNLPVYLSAVLGLFWEEIWAALQARSLNWFVLIAMLVVAGISHSAWCSGFLDSFAVPVRNPEVAIENPIYSPTNLSFNFHAVSNSNSFIGEFELLGVISIGSKTYEIPPTGFDSKNGYAPFSLSSGLPIGTYTYDVFTRRRCLSFFLKAVEKWEPLTVPRESVGSFIVSPSGG